MNGPFSLDPTFCAWLTLAMAHFLWQGLLVTALACAAARWLREASPGSRHRVYAAALALMLACFPATLGLLYLSNDVTPATMGAKDPAGVDDKLVSGLHVAAGGHSTIAADPVAGFRVSEASGVISTVPRLARWTATGYLMGICIMFGRMMLALRGGWRLRRDALPLDDPALLAAVKRLAERLGLSAAPLVAYCDRVAVPAVVGVLRPAILLPVTLTTGLAPGQIELVIAHEMAHLRRWDHLMMLVQRIAESVLFFHPALWYLSRRLSVERELCCDEMVVSSGARPSDYAETLLRVVESCRRPAHRLPEVALAMAPGRGRPAALVHRVMCILGQRSGSPVRLGRLWSIGLASTIVLATALCVWLCVRAESADATAEDVRLVRLIIREEMIRVHWAGLETDEEFLPTIDALWNDLFEESEIGVSWTARFLRSESKKKPPLTLTDFEKEALARIDQGETEVLQRFDTGVVRYVRPIRARRTCVTLCHPEWSGAARVLVKEGDLVGVMSVEIVPKQGTTPGR